MTKYLPSASTATSVTYPAIYIGKTVLVLTEKQKLFSFQGMNSLLQKPVDLMSFNEFYRENYTILTQVSNNVFQKEDSL